MNRARIIALMEELEKLSSFDYNTFELALVLFLRTDTFELKNNISDSQLETIEKLVKNSETIMSDELRENVEFILDEESEDDEDE
jgi:hypothetical protein